MSGDTIGEINYLTSTFDGCSAWTVVHSMPAVQRTNFAQTLTPMTIHDLRGKEKSFNLDTHGFEVLPYHGSVQEHFENDSEAHRTYFEEIIDLLKKRLGASRVVIYHYAFRDRGPPQTHEKLDTNHRSPAYFPHVDADAAGVQKILEETMSKEESEKAMQHRFQVINVWRPIGPNPITQKPLTVCDYWSVDQKKDVHPLTLRGCEHNSSALIMSRNPQDAHTWYYINQMQSNEMFAFKIFDNQPDVAQLGFHTAFVKKDVPIPDVEQKSLEVRCLIFYDE